MIRNISCRFVEDTLIIGIFKNLEEETIDFIKEEIEEYSENLQDTLVINLNGIDSFQNSALVLLLKILVRLKRIDFEILLVCSESRLRRSLELMEMDKEFHVFRSEEKALEHLYGKTILKATEKQEEKGFFSKFNFRSILKNIKSVARTFSSLP